MAKFRNIKSFRQRARLSQSRLARIANVSRDTISRAERGLPVENKTTFAIAKALAQSLKIDSKIILEEISELENKIDPNEPWPK